MATYQSIRSVSADAAAALTIYRFAVFNASGQAAVPAQGVFCDGIVLESVASGLTTSLGLPDGAIVKVEAAAAIAAGANVTPSANGRGETAASGDVIMGKALQAAAAAGEIIEMQFLYRGVVA